MEKDCVPLSEVGFRRWMIRNFWELKELVLTQCKETKNFEKRFEVMYLTKVLGVPKLLSLCWSSPSLIAS